MKKLLLIAIIALSFMGCTENQRAKNFGGNAEINLPAGQKLVIATWKDDNLWYLTKSMGPNDSAETYTFQEKSSYGVWQGTYTIIESK